MMDENIPREKDNQFLGLLPLAKRAFLGNPLYIHFYTCALLY